MESLHKPDIIRWFEQEIDAVNRLIEDTAPSKRHLKPLGKWSMADHLAHLNLSILPLESRMPFPLQSLEALGVPDRPSLPIEKMKATYQGLLQTGLKAPDRLDPDAQPPQDFEAIQAQFNAIHSSFLLKMAPWQEEDLDRYWMKHPAMGLITVREMLVFLVFHIGHHRQGMVLSSSVIG